MNNLEKLTDALSDVGGQYIEEAASYERAASRKRVWLRLGATAASVALIVSGIFVVRALRSAPEDVPEPSVDMPEPSVDVPEPSVDDPSTKIDFTPPMGEPFDHEKYPLVLWEGRSYHAQDAYLEGRYRIGEALGNVAAEGFSEPDGAPIEKAAALFEITGISPECAVAVLYEGWDDLFIAAVNFTYRPATLGQLVSDLSLRDELYFGPAWQVERLPDGDYLRARYDDLGRGRFCDGVDGERVWELLLSVEDAENVWRDGEPLPDELLSVSIDHRLLGIHDVRLYVYEGGAISTNLLGTDNLFYVGEENTQAFMDYVLNECERTA